ncbi:uncharacterized protein LOC100186745 [Ciona intestinalis]
MSALHWEARRKQAVFDRKSEQQRKQQASKAATLDLYNNDRIKEVANKMSVDPATPTSSLLHRSQAQLIKSRNYEQENTRHHEDKASGLNAELTTKYSAKLKNRYTSINYIQQY